MWNLESYISIHIYVIFIWVLEISSILRRWLNYNILSQSPCFQELLIFHQWILCCVTGVLSFGFADQSVCTFLFCMSAPCSVYIIVLKFIALIILHGEYKFLPSHSQVQLRIWTITISSIPSELYTKFYPNKNNNYFTSLLSNITKITLFLLKLEKVFCNLRSLAVCNYF